MSSHVMPERRDLQFTLPTERISDWNNGNVQLSQFMNTLSLFFPEGERMFIDAVRNCRDQVSDPELKKAMTAFIGQEAMHGREHEDYNQKMVEAGLPVVATSDARPSASMPSVTGEVWSPPSLRRVTTIALCRVRRKASSSAR